VKCQKNNNITRQKVLPMAQSNSTPNTYEYAADCLRKAVPLMVQHRVPVTPINYALWYSYVGGDRPALKSRLDAILESFGTCPASAGEALFREHFTEFSGEDLCQLRSQVESLVGGLKGELDRMMGGTRNFGETLQACSEELRRREGQGVEADLVGLVDRLAAETNAMRSTAGEVERQLGNAEAEIARLRQELARTRQEALNDALTGLPNRRAFDADLAQMAGVPRATGSLCLVLADVDHFKKFNDRFGHALGDQVLKMVASRLGGASRDGVRSYRYGGEEFAVLVTGGAAAAGAVAESLRAAVERLVLKDNATGKALSAISASFGVAQLEAGEAGASLIERADQALYRAKAEGRNRVCLAD
jgi:diguanylate cyclase